MKLHYDPKVYLMARTVNRDDSLRKFLKDEGFEWSSDSVYPAQQAVETAGRLCYMSFSKPRPGGNKAYLDNILGSGHGSVIEHPSWSFIFSGISRTLSHELVRHRAGWAYSQLSQRYVDESVAEYVVPHDYRDAVEYALLVRKVDEGLMGEGEVLKGYSSGEYCDRLDLLVKGTRFEDVDPDSTDHLLGVGMTWLQSVENSHGAYVSQVEENMRATLDRGYREYLSGIPQGHAAAEREYWEKSLPAERRTAMRKEVRQAARSVLPNATETKVYATANARALRHFIEMRASRYADPEIRKLAVAVLRIVRDDAPGLFGDYELTPLPDGTFEAVGKYRKV